MTRPLRIEYSGAFYHITARGNQKQQIFLSPRDFNLFFEILDMAFERYTYFLHCFVLMNNHYHLIIETPDGNLSKILQFINGRYTQSFNKHNRKTGHLFQGRYKSILIQEEKYLLELSRYIHLNPVRANLVNDPAKYQWSSLPYYLEKLNIPRWFKINCIKSYWNNFDDNEFYTAYYEFLCSKIQETKKEEIFKNIYGQSMLGDVEFIDKIKKMGVKTGKETSHNYLYEKRPKIEDIVIETAKYYKVKIEDIKCSMKRFNIARQIAIYLARKWTSEGNEFIGEYFCNNSASSVSKTFARVEEKRRNDKLIDKGLSVIEKNLMSNVNG